MRASNFLVSLANVTASAIDCVTIESTKEPFKILFPDADDNLLQKQAEMSLNIAKFVIDIECSMILTAAMIARMVEEKSVQRVIEFHTACVMNGFQCAQSEVYKK